MRKINFNIFHQPKSRRILFVCGILSISLISLIFIINNFKDNIVFFYSPSEFDKIISSQKNIRVGGMIKENSIQKIDSLTTIFTITDYKNELNIKYSGILPDLFRESQGVVANGKYFSNEKLFITDELLVKHDENYMPPEVAKDLKMKVAK
jgi:cytochrome c-type biogenesis protein CcmE